MPEYKKCTSLQKSRVASVASHNTRKLTKTKTNKQQMAVITHHSVLNSGLHVEHHVSRNPALEVDERLVHLHAAHHVGHDDLLAHSGLPPSQGAAADAVVEGHAAKQRLQGDQGLSVDLEVVGDALSDVLELTRDLVLGNSTVMHTEHG